MANEQEMLKENRMTKVFKLRIGDGTLQLDKTLTKTIIHIIIQFRVLNNSFLMQWGQQACTLLVTIKVRV